MNFFFKKLVFFKFGFYKIVYHSLHFKKFPEILKYRTIGQNDSISMHLAIKPTSKSMIQFCGFTTHKNQLSTWKNPNHKALNVCITINYIKYFTA